MRRKGSMRVHLALAFAISWIGLAWGARSLLQQEGSASGLSLSKEGDAELKAILVRDPLAPPSNGDRSLPPPAPRVTSS